MTKDRFPGWKIFDPHLQHLSGSTDLLYVDILELVQQLRITLIIGKHAERNPRWKLELQIHAGTVTLKNF